MKILVIGSGGREHAICETFRRSPRVSKIYCANGNAGIADVAELVKVRPDDIDGLVKFADSESIDLTFVGGETSLALGVVDAFEQKGLRIIGVSKAAARLEASKSFAKDFMQRHSIPTAAYRTARSVTEAREFLNLPEFGDSGSPVVVKADGLAAGKGVVVAASKDEAFKAIGELGSLVGDEASETIVIEECLAGREVSLILFCDGTNFALMPPTRDHKRIGEGDTGPNTGGMGTITDASLLTGEQTEYIERKIIRPTMEGCRSEGFLFRGIMFLGLMLTSDGPKVLEYNVRFGDPETQAILVRLDTDLVDICENMLEGSIDTMPIEWKSGSSACVILASEGYPGKPRTGDVITGLDDAKMKDIKIFHSGTAKNGSGEFVTAGGRVLGITSVGNDLETAVAWAYHAAEKISWNGIQFRKDIGK